MNQQMLCTRGRASWQLGKAGSRLLCGKSLPVEESFWRIPFRQRVKKWLNRSIKAIFPIVANSLPLFKHLACGVLCIVCLNGTLYILILTIGNFSPPKTCTYSAKGVIWQYCRWAVCILQLGSKICQVMALQPPWKKSIGIVGSCRCWVIIVIGVWWPHGLTRVRKGTDLGLIQVIHP